jgi:uncharacterized protein (DUF2141 family)
MAFDCIDRLFNRLLRGAIASGRMGPQLRLGDDMPRLTVTVSGVRNAAGAVIGGLYAEDDWRRFDKGSPIVEAIAPAHEGGVELVFEDVPAGRWGLAVFHDENNNGRMDLNIVGVPAEGRGYPGIGAPLGAPLFEDASVLVEGAVTVSVALAYVGG